MIHSELEQEVREKLLAIIEHMEHVLPAQAPIKDFVHHNTLHGFQHLRFSHALRSVHQFTGVNGYQSSQQFRQYYRSGRINDDDLDDSLQRDGSFDGDTDILSFSDKNISSKDIVMTAMIYGIEPTSSNQLNWLIEEKNILARFQDDIADNARERLLSESDESTAVRALWASCLQCLDLDHEFLHPEDHYDLTPERAQKLLQKMAAEDVQETTDGMLLHHTIRKVSDQQREALWKRIGNELTLRGLLKILTGHDILDDYKPALLRHIASFLDQGVSSWHHRGRDDGFFASWRRSALHDFNRHDNELPDWEDEITSLPEDATETIMMELDHLGLDEEQWAEYLEQLALEIPGWSGMFLWLHKNPGYDGMTQHVSMMDYLAVRLVLERLYAQRLARRKWRIEASLYTLHWYFHRRRSELFVRLALFNEHLPEFLISRANRLANQNASLVDNYSQWQQLADMIWAWQHNSKLNDHSQYRIYQHGWQLFRLMQLSGVTAEEVKSINAEQLSAIFDILNKLDASKEGYLWLQAYEHNYRQIFFNAIASNSHSKADQLQTGRAIKTTPTAQVFFCMDDREEGIRRHIETINPTIETLGVAAFFDLPILWQGIDDDKPMKLAPITIEPENSIDEIPQSNVPNETGGWEKHRSRVKKRKLAEDILSHEIRRNLLSSTLSLLLTAPAALLTLIAKSVAPLKTGQLLQRLRTSFEIPVSTDIEFTTMPDTPPAEEGETVVGFNDDQQTERVAGFLKNHGLTKNFAPLVVLMGHTSTNENNPHQSAYGCGACSGKFGGPNGRVFARIANRPEIRARLAEKGINIPAGSWFIGAMHNTCNEHFDWYDEHLIPENLSEPFKQFKADMLQSALLSAHERCRKFASAPTDPTLQQAANHIAARALDYSQARPELGHATIAAGVIGRRTVTSGLFLDRRLFLISYDPHSDDDEGTILENILRTAGPVGAGINLEYYFSTASNQQFGSGSKISHNVAGFFGVMEGTGSDLRTGLPKQMIEIHEPMRLQLLIEAKPEVIAQVYHRQPVVKELVANEWLLISSIDPDSGVIKAFNPTTGFEDWSTKNNQPLKQVKRWQDWYQGHMQPLDPVTLKPVNHEPVNHEPVNHEPATLKPTGDLP